MTLLIDNDEMLGQQDAYNMVLVVASIDWNAGMSFCENEVLDHLVDLHVTT